MEKLIKKTKPSVVKRLRALLAEFQLRRTSGLRKVSLSKSKPWWATIDWKDVWRTLQNNTLAPFSLIGIFILIGSILFNSYTGTDFYQFTAVTHRTIAELAMANTTLNEDLSYTLSDTVMVVDQDYLFNTGGIETIISKNNRQSTIEYTVKAGESLASVASGFGLASSTVKYVNNLSGATLKEGQKLRIPPTDGLYIKVQRNDTISALAKRYNISTDSIYKYNPDITPGKAIFAGHELFIPGAVITRTEYNQSTNSTYQPPSNVPGYVPPKTGEGFAWPTSNPTHYLSQSFGRRHTGIDLNRLNGVGIYASRGGVVTSASWNRGGYGNLVIIKHSGGWETYYAHLASIKVKVGETVSQGQLVGIMGTTGRSTGIHLHFEIRKNNGILNPISYLP